ncbi:hypothetical protein [Mucilaginibacter paludis]|uniref:Uncharacterized protein n=1 Tax=Mucilaginibacter paludis DSM 18603 TaxID=714943 RepID=H1YAX6_9SPHI|nr:hypothetical protein [Mucilaginibacter paludis]EHQ30009.1 hypothetical protein Mucpa_5949 [Mucilaginibacter paludis DSM 18603]
MRNFSITPRVATNVLNTKTLGTATNIDLEISLVIGDAFATGEYHLYDSNRTQLDTDTGITIPIAGWAGEEQFLYNAFAAIIGVTLSSDTTPSA